MVKELHMGVILHPLANGENERSIYETDGKEFRSILVEVKEESIMKWGDPKLEMGR